MSYSSLTIKQLISDIASGSKYFLPAIQRKFVWQEEKICNLFNSILHNYPIGTFLFWDLQKEKASKYTFYRFLRNYHQRDTKNELVREDFVYDVRGVLDGQQRISSMYIALQGIYQSKKKHARKSTDEAYPERKFYINLLAPEKDYEFKFLTKQDAMITSELKYYYLVRNILKEPKDADPDDILDVLKENKPDSANLLIENRKIARKKINLMLKKINEENIINYFQITNRELDDILDIFVRVNSGGTVLSKSDLLFSTLVAHWEDGREQIEKLISDMNGEDRQFNFNTDFLMRTCLFLVDAPMSFKVHTFNKKNIEKIHSNWENIRKALIETSSLLREFGFNDVRLSSNYAATPISYYIYNNGVMDDRRKDELRRLVVHSLLKHIYSSHADTVLSELRDGLRQEQTERKGTYQLKNKYFSFDCYKNIKLSGGKKLTVDNADIEGFLEYNKGSFSFLILTILYPNLELGKISFHQDHMHPYSKFKHSKLAELGLNNEKISQWQEMGDQLPNLQLLEGIANKKKQATALEEWVLENYKKRGDSSAEEYYRNQNFIPQCQSLDFKNFGEFFSSRKEILRQKLREYFTSDL